MIDPVLSLTQNSPLVIRADQVSKNFTIRKDKSLKERIVEFSHGRKHRESFHALDNVSFEVNAGTTVALIGHNGSGKSTLLKVLGGIIDPSSGVVSRRGRIAALLELGAGFHPDLSGRDNVYLNASLLGLSREETDSVFESIVAFAELEEFIDAQVKFYSSGMYVRLAFAVAIHTDPDILLVDEVLAVGDEAFQRKCMDKIREFQAEGRTILLVTHNLNQVLELADSAVLLHHGKLLYNGEPREAVARFRDLLEEQRLEHETAQEPSDETQPEISVVAEAIVPNGKYLQPGDPLTITAEIHGDLGDLDWICAVQIDNSMGQVAIGTTTKRLGYAPLPLSGRATVTFTFEETYFGEGKYFAHISVMNHSSVHLFDAPQACSFDAQTPDDTRGMLYARAAVTSV